MTTLFDRARQRRILDMAQYEYPDAVHSPDMTLANVGTKEELRRELAYLQEHGLLSFREASYAGGSQLRDLRITAKGIDFLADDGGLGAILGVVTVRLDAASIQALLVRQVEASSEPSDVKTKLVAQIKALPAEGVKALTIEGLKRGLSHAPDGLQWLHTFLHGLMS